MSSPAKESTAYTKYSDFHSTVIGWEAPPSALGMERFHVSTGKYRGSRYQSLIRLRFFFSSEQKAAHVFTNILPNLKQIMKQASGNLDGNKINLFVESRSLKENYQPTILLQQIRQAIKGVFFPLQVKTKMGLDLGTEDLCYYPPRITLKLKYNGFEYTLYEMSQEEREIFSKYKEGDEISLKRLFPNRKWAPFYEPLIQQSDQVTIQKIYPFRWDYQELAEMPETDEVWANGYQQNLNEAIQNIKSVKQDESDQKEITFESLSSKILPENDPSAEG